MRLTILTMLFLVPLAAEANGWTLKPGEVPMTLAELALRLDGQVMRFYDGGRSEYGPGNTYAHVFSDDARVPGTYRITDTGEVCIDFENGATRCDFYVQSGNRTILIDEKGDRYPVR